MTRKILINLVFNCIPAAQVQFTDVTSPFYSERRQVIKKSERRKRVGNARLPSRHWRAASRAVTPLSFRRRTVNRSVRRAERSVCLGMRDYLYKLKLVNESANLENI